MFKRKPYRKGREYFYIMTMTNGTRTGHVASSLFPNTHQDAKEVYLWAYERTRKQFGFPEEGTVVVSYHIEKN